jgi:hypothetical protein
MRDVPVRVRATPGSAGSRSTLAGHPHLAMASLFRGPSSQSSECSQAGPPSRPSRPPRLVLDSLSSSQRR